MTEYLVRKHTAQINDLKERMTRAELELGLQQVQLSIILATLTARIVCR